MCTKLKITLAAVCAGSGRSDLMSFMSVEEWGEVSLHYRRLYQADAHPCSERLEVTSDTTLHL